MTWLDLNTKKIMSSTRRHETIGRMQVKFIFDQQFSQFMIIEILNDDGSRYSLNDSETTQKSNFKTQNTDIVTL